MFTYYYHNIVIIIIGDYQNNEGLKLIVLIIILKNLHNVTQQITRGLYKNHVSKVAGKNRGWWKKKSMPCHMCDFIVEKFQGIGHRRYSEKQPGK